MELRVGSHTDVGRTREINEDSLLLDVPLFGVADGMGGHNAGEVASGIAIEVLTTWKDRLAQPEGRRHGEILKDAFTDANHSIYEKGREDEALEGMGTTLTVGWLESNTLSLAHVGDSRAYLLRGGQLQQLTEDQNVAQEMMRRGKLSKEEAATSRYRHMVLQAIGVDDEALSVDTVNVEIRPGDRIALMTDGSFGMIRSDERIKELLAGNDDPDEAARKIVEAANAAGGEDNISVVIVDVVGDPSTVTDDEPAPLVIERGEPVPVKRAPSRRIPRQVPLIAGAVLLLAAMAYFLVIRPNATPSYVVSSRDGNVVVLDGRPASTDEAAATGKVVKVFRDTRSKEFPTTVRRELRVGIPVDTLEEADDVVARLPRELGTSGTPTPKPKPSPTASAEVSLPPATGAP